MITDAVSKAKFLVLFTKMQNNEMTLDECAAEFATTVNEIIKTAEVQTGIPVSTSGTEFAQTGATTANGVII